MANTKPDRSPKKTTAASEVEIEANRRAARLDAAEVVEGLRKLAKQKAARKAHPLGPPWHRAPPCESEPSSDSELPTFGRGERGSRQPAGGTCYNMRT
jgi:hypothetical protein